jgi:N-acetylglutamate synthase/N-acetylornithine aminotransferase
VVTSCTPINAAAVFTTNVFQAAPVAVSKRILDVTCGAGIGGLVVNSGCANAVTGEGGMKDAENMGSKYWRWKCVGDVYWGAVERSFNAISVDGAMSTNDTLSILANGAASIPEITGGKPFDQFQSVVTGFAEELAKLVVWDGKGATKFVTIRVKVPL